MSDKSLFSQLTEKCERLVAENERQDELINLVRKVCSEEECEGRLYGRNRFDWRIAEALDAFDANRREKT